MDVNRYAEHRDTFPERGQRSMIQILSVGVAVDHRTAEAEISDAALQFVSRGGRILHRQMREAGVATGAPLNFSRQEIVGPRCHLDRGCGIWLDLDAGAGEGKNRLVNSGSVHGSDPAVAKIG
jgi:hypothetical protein